MPATTQRNSSLEDLKMEYKLKYERLVDVHHESIQAFADMVKSAEIHKEAYQNYVNELKKVAFEKDMKVYNLEEENKKLKLELENLRLELNKEQLEKSGFEKKSHDIEFDGSHSKSRRNKINKNQSVQPRLSNLSSKNPVTETPITESTLPQNDSISPFILPETPRRVSRYLRRSMMKEAIDKMTPEEEGEKYDFFREIIIKQKDLLDFYATISGFMIRNFNDDAKSSEEEVDLFRMKHSEFKDLEVQFAVDYEGDDIEYHLVSIPEELEQHLEKFAPFLEENLYFSSEDAPKILKSIFDVIEIGQQSQKT